MKEPKHANMGKEFPHTDQILPLSAIVFFLIWGLDSFIFKLSAQFTNFIPDIVQITLFIILELSAIVLGIYSHRALFEQEREKYTLITNGVFAHVRHPLYLSVLLAYLGFTFVSMSIVSLIPWTFYIILFDKMATYEEKDLTKILGDKYLEYRKKIPKWIPNPFLSRKKKDKTT